jgi:gas vesicle protein
MSESPSARRSFLRWVAHYKPVTVCVESDTGDEHRIVVDQKNAKRWDAVYQNAMSLNACVARCLDARENVLGTYVIRKIEKEDTRDVVNAPATTGGVDIAAIINTVADACVRVAEKAMQASADAHKQSFTEMVNLAKEHSSRAKSLEEALHATLEERERRLDEAEERAEDERERVEKEREQEREESQGLKELMGPILAAAGPQLVASILEKKSNGAPEKIKVEAKPVTEAPSGKA